MGKKKGQKSTFSETLKNFYEDGMIDKICLVFPSTLLMVFKPPSWAPGGLLSFA
jgi:hypothetical protein